MAKKAPRCDYCNKSSVVIAERQVRYMKLGRVRAMTVRHGTCADHESCVAWRSLMDAIPSQKVTRIQ